MKQAILERLQALGGDISLVKGESLAEDLCTITFDTILYKKPLWAPWMDENGEEPIDGLGEFLDANLTLYQADKERFFQKLYETYFILTEVPYGQYFWLGEMFTPFQEGSRDFEAWHEVFQGEIYCFMAMVSRMGFILPVKIKMLTIQGFLPLTTRLGLSKLMMRAIWKVIYILFGQRKSCVLR